MKNKPYWILGLVGILAVILVPLIVFWPKANATADDPWSHVPEHPVHTSHADIIKGPFATGQDVTKACLQCHPNAAADMMKTTHFTWESKPFTVPGRDKPVTIGKANQINNFCISAQGNQKSCTACHVGQGWKEITSPDQMAFDYSKPENVDCLICHASSGYAKGTYGNPAETVDLVAAAKSVAAPNRAMCGNCHFNGGGGNNVKHGDLDQSLIFPSEDLDVHMGKNNFSCTDCHVTKDHQVKGRLVVDNYYVDPNEQVSCTQCHAETPHTDERLNKHTVSVACQTCHVPTIAMKDPTKVNWDWSTSGKDIGDDHFTYLKIKGSFEYDKNITPQYLWFNGNLDYRYILGDKIDPSKVTYINKPAGDIKDEKAKIFPFKLHVANQPYDTKLNTLLAPVTSGPGGYWTTFEWASAFKLAQERLGIPFSGEYGFTETYMYWPSTHMVQPKENALQCNECHSPNGRMDWKALGYPGDPIDFGGRFEPK